MRWGLKCVHYKIKNNAAYIVDGEKHNTTSNVHQIQGDTIENRTRRDVLPIYSQVEFFVPYRIKLLWHCVCPLLDLAHLHRDVGVRCAALVLGDEPLGAYN